MTNLTINEVYAIGAPIVLAMILLEAVSYTHLRAHETARQLALTLHLYFKKEKSLFLCEIDERNLNKSEYCFEKALSDNRAEQDFPHIYGKLSIEQISKTWRLEKKAFQIPKEILIDLEENTIYSSHLSRLHK